MLENSLLRRPPEGEFDTEEATLVTKGATMVTSC